MFTSKPKSKKKLMHVRSNGFQATADTNIILGEHVDGVVGSICNGFISGIQLQLELLRKPVSFTNVPLAVH